MNKWTIFGVSDLMLEIIDAIHHNNDRLKQIVINMPIRESLLKDIDKYHIVKIEDYKYDHEYNIFGFTDVNKEPFLAKLPGLPFQNVIHPKAHFDSSAVICWGNYLAPGVVIGARVVLKEHNIVNRNASIGHHTMVGSCNHFGPGSIVCGRCEIGSKNFLGAGSIVKDRVRIGNNVTIGAGAVVVNDILESGVYVGVPAKRVNLSFSEEVHPYRPTANPGP